MQQHIEVFDSFELAESFRSIEYYPQTKPLLLLMNKDLIIISGLIHSDKEIKQYVYRADVLALNTTAMLSLDCF